MSDVLWERKGINGTVSKGELSVGVAFDVACDAHGTLEFEFAPIPLNTDTSWLLTAWHNRERYAQPFQLRGRHDDGTLVSTDHLYLISLGEHSSADDGATMTLKGTTSWLEVTQPFETEGADATVAVYRVIGIEGFKVLCTEIPEGRLEIAGETRPLDHSKVTGWMRIEGADSGAGDLLQWIKQCDRRTILVLDVLSLVLDCDLWWSVREVFDPATATVTLNFRGPVPEPSQPQHPILSHLHLQPVIELIHNYSEDLRKNAGMGTSIALFLMRPTYVEPRFMAAMSGLDHLLQKYGKQLPSGALMNKTVFRNCILPRLKQAVDECIGDLERTLSEDIADALRAKLKGLNQTTLRNKLLAFLEHYNVPLAGITYEQLVALIRVRNDLFHGRDFEPRHEGDLLSDHVAVLHELLQRIFLTLLGYRGDRWTFLNGQERVKFPPPE